MAKKKRMNVRDLHKRLRTSMSDNGITHAEMARHIGVCAETFSAKITGESDWTTLEMYRIMDHLGISHDQMYLYFPPDGIDIEPTADRTVRDYLADTDQKPVPIGLIETLLTVAEAIAR